MGMGRGSQKSQWDQTAFEKMKADWPVERIIEDENTLQELFKLADDCPLLAEALSWAEKHGVKFFIDHTSVNCSGYYMPTTGVVGIAARYAGNHDSIVGTLVHEIRHAWQDYQGLLTDGTNKKEGFAGSFISTALLEADAWAYGRVAGQQYTEKKHFEVRKKRRQWGRKISKKLRAQVEQKTAEEHERYLRTLQEENQLVGLQQEFLNWFSISSETTQYYGDFLSKVHGKEHNLYEGELPARNFEFSIPATENNSGLNIHDIQDVLRLGMNFSSTKNYIAEMPREFLLKSILKPSLANTFWGKASPSQSKLTTELRKASLQQKLAHRPKVAAKLSK